MRSVPVLVLLLPLCLVATDAAAATPPTTAAQLAPEPTPLAVRARLRTHRRWLDRVARKFPAWAQKLRSRRKEMLAARRAFLRDRQDGALRKKAFKATLRYLKKALLPYKEHRLKLAKKNKDRVRVARLQEQIAKINAKLATLKDATK